MFSLLGSMVLLAMLWTAEGTCIPDCLADEVCNNSSVCEANKTYYASSGLTLYNTSSTVTCKGSNMTMSVGKNLLEFLNYNPSASTLSQYNCTGAQLDILGGQRVYSLIVQTTNGICGNTMTTNSTHVTFANIINIPGKNTNGIVAAGNISIQFSCSYNITMQTSLYTVIKPVMTCSTSNGPYIQVVENGVSKEVRFSITSFAFQGFDSVYIFCDARLCNNASGSCSKCSSSRDASLDSTQFTLGPFTFLDNTEYSSSSRTGFSVTLLFGSLLCLWIHLKTEII
ncbi:hypothetical protein GDO81_006096 [Engystomops pustulosus]|uniref:ZP domain-containing protein n=1 Tax=Engystomops pustulosus TaxID=76066 RepID=A0AAV7CWK3_ENGPU|nr:hypothetical protein GDO81_006096 [Engystomops pustulosus]